MTFKTMLYIVIANYYIANAINECYNVVKIRITYGGEKG